MQPCESRRNCQPETAETDFFILSEGRRRNRSGKQKFRGMSAIGNRGKTQQQKTHQNRARMRFNAFLCFQQGLTKRVPGAPNQPLSQKMHRKRADNILACL